MVAAQTFVKRAVCQRFAVVHCMAVATRDSFMLGNAVRIMGVAGIAFFVGKHDFGSGFYERLPACRSGKTGRRRCSPGTSWRRFGHVVGRRLSFVHLGKRVLVVVGSRCTPPRHETRLRRRHPHKTPVRRRGTWHIPRLPTCRRSFGRIVSRPFGRRSTACKHAGQAYRSQSGPSAFRIDSHLSASFTRPVVSEAPETTGRRDRQSVRRTRLRAPPHSLRARRPEEMASLKLPPTLYLYG